MSIPVGALTGRAFDLNWSQEKFNQWNGTTYRQDLLPYTVPMLPQIYDEQEESQFRSIERLFQDEYYVRSVLRDVNLGVGDNYHQLSYFEQRHNISSLEDAMRYGPAWATIWTGLALKVDQKDCSPQGAITSKRTKGGDYIAIARNAGEYYNVRDLAAEAPLVPIELQLGKSDYYRQLDLCVWDAQAHNLDTVPVLLFQEQLSSHFRAIIQNEEVKYFFERMGLQVVNVDCNIAFLKYDKRFEHQYDKSRSSANYFIGVFYTGETSVTHNGLRYPKPVTFL